MAAMYLKALRAGRRGTLTDFVWPEPGVWLEVDGDLVPCENGLHVCRADQIVEWLNECLWLVEVDGGEMVDHGDKMVVRRARLVRPLAAWDERTARLFAADCAERVLHIFDDAHPGDDRPRKAIEASRAFSRGEIGATAWDAAVATARDAAVATARDAAVATARDEAWAAARDAAVAAARAEAWAEAWAEARVAAWDAAWVAERRWQTEALLDLLDLTASERALLDGH